MVKRKNFTFTKVEDEPTGIRISFQENLGDDTHIHHFICKDKYYDAIDSFKELKKGDKLIINIKRKNLTNVQK